ncbi:hypothetical protein C1645_752036 [Glomus cerebriforme]|uniref:Uncharacterized protein n=1 Tax=Glomus cerebriforme TaxID=658196 RepID=A0A397TME5_9GLOM|nr:hypothetical protein C1645_752036 [Glomus cerebriforme]
MFHNIRVFAEISNYYVFCVILIFLSYKNIYYPINFRQFRYCFEFRQVVFLNRSVSPFFFV